MTYLNKYINNKPFTQYHHIFLIKLIKSEGIVTLHEHSNDVDSLWQKTEKTGRSLY